MLIYRLFYLSVKKGNIMSKETQKIEITFPIKVEIPLKAKRLISCAIDMICKKNCPENYVMWLFGQGKKMTYMPLTLEEEQQRGIEFDDSVDCFEVSCREVYPEELERRKNQKRRFEPVLIDFDPIVAGILGTQVFNSVLIADNLRKKGHNIKEKTESEQAYVLFWLLSMYYEHGKDWFVKANEYLKSSVNSNKDESSGKGE